MQLMVMRTFIFLFCISVFSLTPKNLFSQENITINVDKEVSVDEVFNIIQGQTNYRFLYPQDLFLDAPKVQLKKGLIRISKLLEISFKGNNVKFELSDANTIVIKEIPSPIKAPKEKPIPQKQIEGTVTDANGQPLPGASVLEKGTANGAQTDFDGNFSISVTDQNAILVISYLGFITQEILVGAQTDIVVALAEDAASLEEVVVIGYGSVRKSDLTGSVVSLSEDDLNQVNPTSVDQMLQGRAAGVQITQASQAPGGGVSIRIRGTGSITAGQEPLYVVDGFPINNAPAASGSFTSGFDGGLPEANPLNSINPADIKSIEILKDASAAAIYGSRGANGVIIITTKSGSSGKPKFSYSTSYAISQISNKIDVLSTSEYIDVMNQLEIARGNTAPFDSSFISSVGAGTDWQDVILQVGSTQRHNLSLSGQSESGDTNYYSSISYFNQEGIIKNTGYDRYQARLNIEQKVGKNFTFGMKINTSLEKNQQVPVNGFELNEQADAVNTALNMAPIFPIFNDDGSIFGPQTDGIVGITLGNPYAKIHGQSLNDVDDRTLINLFGEYSITPDLKAKVTLGSDRASKRRDIYSNRTSLQGALAGGIATVIGGELSNSLVEGILTYSKTFADKHSLTILAGSTYQSFKNRRFSAGTQGFASDVVKTNALGIGTQSTNTVGSFSTERRLLSYLGRINYGFSDKYLLTASIRADGSSNFGANNRYGYFPSFSGGWKINNEAFLKDSEVVSELKLRAGWGQLGNDNIGIARAIATFSEGPIAIYGGQQIAGISPSRIPNPDLKWETSEQFNVGLDFGFFNSRIKGSIDYYKKSNKELLLNLPIPSTSGFSRIASNIGQVDNSGFEFMLSTVNLTGDLNWTTDFNITTTKNEVVSLGPLPEIIENNSDHDYLIRPGEALYSFYGTKVIGIFQEGQAPIAAQPDIVPGNPIWYDANNDDVIDAEDRVVLGDPYPDFTFGLNNSLSYNNLTLNVFVEGSIGMEMINYTTREALYPNDTFRNRLAEPFLNRWTPDNPSNTWPSGIDPATYGGSISSSFSVADASFVRLRNVQLSYAVPLVDNSFFKSLDISLGGENLFVITDYPGYDPDVNSAGQSGIRIDRNAYPSARLYQIGINVGF